MSDHPWCRDVARDEAVRAAEDAVERPAVPDWREIPERVAALEREVASLRAPVEGEAEVERLRAERNAAIRERDAALARVAEWESAAKLAPAANVGGGSNQADAEPFAWAFECSDGVWSFTHLPQVAAKWPRAEVVPLYRSPPPPRGWLTAEERSVINQVMPSLADTEQETLLEMLSRNSPPKVRLPEGLCWVESNVRYYRMREVYDALAAAGVEVEE